MAEEKKDQKKEKEFFNEKIPFKEDVITVDCRGYYSEDCGKEEKQELK